MRDEKAFERVIRSLAEGKLNDFVKDFIQKNDVLDGRVQQRFCLQHLRYEKDCPCEKSKRYVRTGRSLAYVALHSNLREKTQSYQNWQDMITFLHVSYSLSVICLEIPLLYQRHNCRMKKWTLTVRNKIATRKRPLSGCSWNRLLRIDHSTTTRINQDMVGDDSECIRYLVYLTISNSSKGNWSYLDDNK